MTAWFQELRDQDAIDGSLAFERVVTLASAQAEVDKSGAAQAVSDNTPAAFLAQGERVVGALDVDATIYSII